MRLTLRGLLAYLDDRLTPESAAQVGDYLQEHDKIRQLTDRIKRVIRRRRLSTPDVAERQELPHLHQDDPNEVAAFLDGTMNNEQEADFEEICIDTDVYLAEVAACHQIMTFGNDTLKVPPLAKQRMIALVKGPEAQPMKIVPREGRPSKPPLWEVTDSAPAHPEEENQALLEPIYHDLLATRWSKALFAVAALLLVGFFGYIVWSIPWDRIPVAATEVAAVLPEATVPANPVDVVPKPADVAAKPVEAVAKPEAAKPAAPILVKQPLQLQALWPVAIVSSERHLPSQGVAQTVAGIAGMMAARPAMPLNILLGLGEESKSLEPITPLPVLANAKSRMPAPERTTRIPVATNSADTLGMFLQQNATGDFRIMKPQAQLVSNEKLLALPGYTGQIALQNGLKLVLLGQFSPQLQANPFAEAVVELHPTKEADVDVTLHTGRLVLMGRPAQQGSATIRLRYFGESWEITIPSGAELGIQARAQVVPGDGAWVIERYLELISAKGLIDIQHEEQSVSLRTRQRLQWNSSLAEHQPAAMSELAELPVWLAKYQTAPKEAVDSLVALRARTHAKLEREANDLKWFALACEETLEEGKLIDRQAALLGLTSLDRLKPVLALQNDANANGRRKYSHEVIHHWLNQDPARAQALLTLLKEIGYTESDANLLLALYRGTTQSTPAKIQALIQHLGHERVAIREQAWQLLTALAPERPNIFDPVGPEDQRTKAIAIIAGKLNQKPAGDVPPPP